MWTTVLYFRQHTSLTWWSNQPLLTRSTKLEVVRMRVPSLEMSPAHTLELLKGRKVRFVGLSMFLTCFFFRFVCFSVLLQHMWSPHLGSEILPCSLPSAFAQTNQTRQSSKESSETDLLCTTAQARRWGLNVNANSQRRNLKTCWVAKDKFC